MKKSKRKQKKKRRKEEKKRVKKTRGTLSAQRQLRPMAQHPLSETGTMLSSLPR
jgi:hypothetical protein